MRRIGLLLAALVLVGGACGGNEEPEPTPVGTAAINDHGTESFDTEAFDLELEVDNFYFDPTFVKAPGDSTATVSLSNEGSAQHTFTIDDLNVDETLDPGASKQITVKLGTATRYEYYCRFHADQGMRGAFQPH